MRTSLRPPVIAAAIRAYPGWAAAGINPNDYISTGNNRHPFNGVSSSPGSVCPMTFNGRPRSLCSLGGAGTRLYSRSFIVHRFRDLKRSRTSMESVVPILPDAGPSAPNRGNLRQRAIANRSQYASRSCRQDRGEKFIYSTTTPRIPIRMKSSSGSGSGSGRLIRRFSSPISSLTTSIRKWSEIGCQTVITMRAALLNPPTRGSSTKDGIFSRERRHQSRAVAWLWKHLHRQ